MGWDATIRLLTVFSVELHGMDWENVLIKFLLPLSSEVGRSKTDPPNAGMAGTSYLERSQDRLLLLQ